MEKTAAAHSSSFLTEKLIAYIGNKRRLLPFIGSVIDRIRGETPGMTSFLDLFAGSGSVSRLARSKGLTVHANDWEYYSYVLNRPHMMLTPEDAERLFAGHGGIEALLERINTAPFLPADDEYLAAYYAPADDENPDIINERMFYTNHNARRLDAMRTEIERLKPELSDDAYFYLIAAIVYEAATHANTSGVFKGFHAGFGGAGKDALTRIMGDVSLTPLPLIDAPRGTVTQDDANSIIRSLSSRCDIVYLDPPYNQHQYGSNYHLLNTVALWDKPAVNRSIFIDGKKTNKSAIRSDWKRTRSPYCSRATAAAAFADLIRHIDARYILVSYSSDGFIPREEIADILSTRGEVTMASSEYTRYPGARKSIVNRTKNVEHLFIVHAGRSHAVPADVPAQMLVEKVRLLLRRTFLPEHDAAVFHSSGSTIRIKLSHRLFASDTDSVIAALTDADSGLIHDFISFLKERTAANGHQEIMCYLKVLGGHEIHGDYAAILARIPKLYARFSSERDAADFVSITQEICTFLSERLARKDVAAMAIADECIALANKKITDGYISGAQASFVQHLIAGIEAAMRNLTV